MDRQRILITGSSGLIGTALGKALRSLGHATAGLDIRGRVIDRGDIRERSDVRRAVQGCTGIVHLAAVSRVVWGERNPSECWATNVDGLSLVIRETQLSSVRPWVLFASSREVYGRAASLPVTEDAPLRPVNVYGRSKVEGESIVAEAATSHLRTAVVRLSNVYGSTADHPDRVVPAFARAAARGGEIRIEGGMNSFDFTHLDDTVSGLLAMIEAVVHRWTTRPSPIHLVTGQATTLQRLASLAKDFGGSKVSLVEAPPRAFDISHFCGSPLRASRVLGWTAKVRLHDGLARLVRDFQREKDSAPRIASSESSVAPDADAT